MIFRRITIFLFIISLSMFPVSSSLSQNKLELEVTNAKRESLIILGNVSTDELSFKGITRKKFHIIPLVEIWYFVIKEIEPEEPGLIKKLRIEYSRKEVNEETGQIKYIEVILSKSGVVDVFEREIVTQEGKTKIEVKIRLRPVYKTNVRVIEGAVYVAMLDMFGKLIEEEVVLEEGESIEVGVEEEEVEEEEVEEDVDGWPPEPPLPPEEEH